MIAYTADEQYGFALLPPFFRVDRPRDGRVLTGSPPSMAEIPGKHFLRNLVAGRTSFPACPP